MNAYKIPAALGRKYHGSGYALVAVTGEQVMDLVHFDDAALPDFGPDNPGGLAFAITDTRLSPAVRRLQALGQVSVCVLSGWKAVEV